MKKRNIFLALLILLTGCSNKTITTTTEAKAKVYYHYKTLKPYLCLTFDDGPDKVQTPLVLELLDKYEIKATFFVLGEEVEYQNEMVKKVFDAGHEIGNHFYKHENINKMSKDQIRESISKNNELIKSITGTAPTLVRPPYGIVNDNLLEVCAELNMSIIIWTDDKDSKDWNKTPDTTIIKNLLAKPRAGDIFLFHDGDKKNTNTLSALDVIIPTLKNKGFEFVTVSKLLSS